MVTKKPKGLGRGLEALLGPKVVAVVGASRSRQNVGHQVLRNLLGGDFDGPVYPVNPGSPHVASVPAYPSVTAIPGPVDLAVITAIPSIAHSIGKITVAEYVDRPEILRALRNCGVDYAQGYYLSFPIAEISAS